MTKNTAPVSADQSATRSTCPVRGGHSSSSPTGKKPPAPQCTSFATARAPLHTRSFPVRPGAGTSVAPPTQQPPHHPAPPNTHVPRNPSLRNTIGAQPPNQSPILHRDHPSNLPGWPRFRPSPRPHFRAQPTPARYTCSDRLGRTLLAPHEPPIYAGRVPTTQRTAHSRLPSESFASVWQPHSSQGNASAWRSRPGNLGAAMQDQSRIRLHAPCSRLRPDP